MEKGSINGAMASPMTANGLSIKCMERAFSFGKTERSTKDSISRIKSMATEFLLGPMAGNMKDSGKMISSMAEALYINKENVKRVGIWEDGKRIQLD